MKRYFIVLFTFCISLSVFAIETKEFDRIYQEIAINISTTNPVRALYLADSLFVYSTNENQKIKALMLSASILEKQEKRQEGIEYAMEALEIAEGSKNYIFQARIHGFMATQYRLLGFFDKGKAYIQKGLDISEKIEDKNQVRKFQALAYHELADFAADEKDYEKAIEHAKLALIRYQKEENEQLRHFTVANAEELLGRSYMGLGDYSKAYHHFSTAAKLIDKADADNTIWAALIYQGLGALYLNKKELDSAGFYLEKSLLISDESSHGSLRELVYESMARYYKERGELDSSAIYASKHRVLARNNKHLRRQMINSEFNRATMDTNQNASILPNILIFSSVLIGSIFLIYFIRRNISTLKKPSRKQPKKSFKISKKIEEELTIKLDKFEENQDYLDSDMSFSHMVDSLKTNAKYLSHFIKTKKNKDYNTYINDLRIEYILEKLKSEPQYSNYKISYLAQECGFSSHSNFSANFKRVVHLSPSEYIESIDKTESIECMKNAY